METMLFRLLLNKCKPLNNYLHLIDSYIGKDKPSKYSGKRDPAPVAATYWLNTLAVPFWWEHQPQHQQQDQIIKAEN